MGGSFIGDAFSNQYDVARSGNPLGIIGNMISSDPVLQHDPFVKMVSKRSGPPPLLNIFGMVGGGRRPPMFG